MRAVGDVKVGDAQHFVRVGQIHQATVSDRHFPEIDSGAFKPALLNYHANFLVPDHVLRTELQQQRFILLAPAHEVQLQGVFLPNVADCSDDGFAVAEVANEKTDELSLTDGGLDDDQISELYIVAKPALFGVVPFPHALVAPLGHKVSDFVLEKLILQLFVPQFHKSVHSVPLLEVHVLILLPLKLNTR